jgi:membrane protein
VLPSRLPLPGDLGGAYPGRVEVPADWRRLIVDVGRRIGGAGLSLHAAAVAYNAFLALVSLVLALVGLGAFVGRSAAALDRVRETLDAVAPVNVSESITGLFSDAAGRLGGQQGWVVALSVLVALWAGSRSVVALQKALAGVEDQVEARRGLQLRLVALGLTLGGGLALLLVSLLLVFGGRLMLFLEELTGIGALGTLWEWLRVPLSAAGLYLFLLAFYRWGPPRPLPRGWLAALLGTVGALLASLAFGLYLALAPRLGATFGVLGAIAIALVWLYAGAFAVLLGAVLVGYARPGDAAAEPVGRSG